MDNQGKGGDLLDLLNQAVARELQVCIQYMFQHSIGTSPSLAVSGKTPAGKQSKFVTSHSPIWLPGAALRKIGITEMKHAEAIAERIVVLGGEPTTQPDPVIIGNTVKTMLENDREQERGAIELYRHIMEVADREGDLTTKALFQRILSDEETHYRVFSEVLDVA